MNTLETDWTVLGDVLMKVGAFMLVGLAVLACVNVFERNFEKYEAFLFKVDAYLFERPKKVDQRKPSTQSAPAW